MNIVGKCWRCEGEQSFNVKDKDFYNWKDNGVSTQNAFPYLSAGDREFLISRTCECCFDDLFGGDDDE